MKEEGKIIEVRLAKTISVEHREEVHAKILMEKCDIFFGIEHRIEERRNEGAGQQRGKGRMEMCSGCSENHR